MKLDILDDLHIFFPRSVFYFYHIQCLLGILQYVSEPSQEFFISSAWVVAMSYIRTYEIVCNQDHGGDIYYLP